MYECSDTFMSHASQQRGSKNVRLGFGTLRTEKGGLHFINHIFELVLVVVVLVVTQSVCSDKEVPD